MEQLFKSSDSAKIYELSQSNDAMHSTYKNMNWVELARFGSTGIREKSEQMQIFLDYFSDLPPQGSRAWRKQREGAKTLPPTIGGSEINDVTRSTPSAKKEFYKKKLGMSSFFGNIYTQWGNLFEPMIQLYCDTILHTETFETGSIPGLIDESGNVIQSYSPDGVGLINVNDYAKITDAFNRPHPPNSKEEYDAIINRITSKLRKHTEGCKDPDRIINLMEFKCPPTRIPNGTVPDNYYSQPRVGACTIDIVDACLFIDASFRRCSYEQFINSNAQGLTQYNRDSSLHRHDRDDSFPTDNFPLTLNYPMGMIGFYDTSKPYPQDINLMDLFDKEDILTEELKKITDTEEDLLDEFDLDNLESELEKMHVQQAEQAESLAESAKDSTEQAKKEEDLIEPPTIDEILKDRANLHAYAEIARCVIARGLQGNKLHKSRVVLMTQCIWRFIEDENAYITSNMAEDIWQVILILVLSFQDVSAGQVNMYKRIIKDTIRTCINGDAVRNYYACGLDFGLPKNNQYFPEVLRRSINERFALKGYKIYYPKKILHALHSPDDAGNADVHENKDYLNKQLWMFLRECKIRNAKPVGIIPWKLMKTSIVPIEKEPNFLKDIEELVRQVAKEIHQIRLDTHDLPPEEIMEKRMALIEKYCPVKSRVRRAPIKARSEKSQNRANGQGVWDDSMSIHEVGMAGNDEFIDDEPVGIPDQKSLDDLGDL